MDKIIYERAQSAMLARDFGLAARLYKTLLNTDPDDMNILRALGSLYEKSGEDEKALPYYENILTFDPHNVDAMNSIGGIYRRLKQYEKAIEYLNRALEENTDRARVNYTLGFTYKDMGNYDDAIDCFESVVAENPTDVLAYNHLGVIYTSKKNFKKAVLALRRGLQVDPNHPILHYNLGYAYECEKNYPEAIKCYELALKAKPGWVDAIRDLVKNLLICQKTRRAYDLIQKSVQLYPANPELLSMLGKVCIKRFDFDAAEAAYEKADKLKPNDTKIMLGKAESYARNSKLEDASLTAKEAYEIGNLDLSSSKRFIHIMLSAGEMKRAYDEIGRQLVYNQSDTKLLDSKAQYFICAGNPDEAKKIFSQIESLNPNYFHHYLDAARRFCQIGQYDTALEYAKIYVSHRPNNPAGYNMLAKIYEMKGEYENGISELKKGCSLNVENIYGKKEINRLLNEYNDSLQAEVADYIKDFNLQQREAEKEALAKENEEPIAEEQVEEFEEDFDFEQMGGDLPPEEPEEEIDEDTTSVPLLAELSEDEGLDAFDDILNDTEEVLEPEVEEKQKDEMTFDPDEKYAPSNQTVTAPEEKPEQETLPESLFPSEPYTPPESYMPQEPYTPPEPYKQAAQKPDDSFTAEEPYSFPEQKFPQEQNIPQSPYDNFDSRRDRDIDSRIADRIDDAVRKMERTVDDAARQAEERTEEAIKKAEDAVKKVEDAVAKLPSESQLEEMTKASQNDSFNFDSEPEFNLPSNNSSSDTFEIDEMHPEAKFSEPTFEEIENFKDPFGEPLPPSDMMTDPLFSPSLPFETETETETKIEAEIETGEENIWEENQTEETALNSVEEEAKKAVDSAAEFLPNIVKMLEDKSMAEKYKSELGLFQKLRNLSEFLPPDQKEAFLSGKTRLLMDYILAKMSGNPGLVSTITNLLNSGILDTEVDYAELEKQVENVKGDELVCKVMNDLKKLASCLDDKYLSEALCKEADRILARI